MLKCKTRGQKCPIFDLSCHIRAIAAGHDMRISAIAILVTLFLWPAAVFGQSPELMDAYNQVNRLYTEGRYAEAEPLYKCALETWEKALGTDHPNKVCAWCRASIA